MSRRFAVPAALVGSLGVVAASSFVASSSSSRADSATITNTPATAVTRNAPTLPLTSSSITFLGTGSSTGCPRSSCLYSNSSIPDDHCRISKLAVSGDPLTNPNYRNNPSLLIHYSKEGKSSLNIVIDAGKTFRESLTRWLPSLQIPSVDAIVLTHEHMDAFGGMDDIRGMQAWRGGGKGAKMMPVYANGKTLAVVKQTFPYLWPGADEKPCCEGSAPGAVPVQKEQRHVASIDFRAVSPFKPFSVEEGGLSITPLPVVHGEVRVVRLSCLFSI